MTAATIHGKKLILQIVSDMMKEIAIDPKKWNDRDWRWAYSHLMKIKDEVESGWLSMNPLVKDSVEVSK